MTRRVLQQNARKSTAEETSAVHRWDYRLPYMVQHLKRVAPTVVAGQEWTVDQCDDIMREFPNWTYAGGVKFGNCPIFWDTRLMQAEEGTILERRYPSGSRERYMTLIRLQDRALDWGAWFGSMHLAAGGVTEPDEATLRLTQINSIIRDVQAWIGEHPHPEDGKPNLIMCGDINEYSLTTGVRKAAYDLAEWKHLRRRLPLDKIGGHTLRSFNGWRSTSRNYPHDGRWIDDIFTSGVTLAVAALRRTDLDLLPHCASDHNGVAADIITS